MKKNETKELLNDIKGYYNSQFFIDEYVLNAWVETLEPYDLEDAQEHIKEYLKEFPDIPPKPHTFIKGMLTHEQKRKAKTDYVISCQLCGKWMPLGDYDSHYDRCLTIEYLVSTLKDRNATREELERYSNDVLNKLYYKYEPKGVWKV